MAAPAESETPVVPPRKSRLILILTGAFFAAVAAGTHGSILFHISERVAAGFFTGGAYCWLFWWWFHALSHGLPLFHTPLLFYPTGVPLFLHAPVDEIPAVLMQFVMSPYAATNLIMMGTYAATGLAAFVLLENMTRNPWAALCGAFTFAFSDYMVVEHLHGHLVETNLFMPPLVVLAFWKLSEAFSRKNAIIFGAACVGLLLCGPYTFYSFGLIAAFLAVVYEVGTGRKALGSRIWKAAAAALAATAAVGAVVYWPILRYRGQWVGASSVFPVALSSFVEPPFWNPSRLVRALRWTKGENILFPEMTMGYLGVGNLLLLAYGLFGRLWEDRRYRFWLWMFASSAVLALGPWLLLTPLHSLSVPLPYWIIGKLPILSEFRVPARIMITTTLAVAVLSTLSIDRLMRRWPAPFRAFFAIAFVAITFLEFSPWIAAQRAAPAVPGAAYEKVKADHDTFAVLELPLSYTEKGDMFAFAQYYMMMQIYHQHPMVLGFPSRELSSCLSFSDHADVVFEFTHPWIFRRLESDTALQARAHWLASEGSQTLGKLGIKYVIYHSRLPAYDPGTQRFLERWLQKVFGEPILRDESGCELFKVRERHSSPARPETAL